MATRKKNLNILLTVHAIITLAAGIVLIIAPAAIPHTVHIQIHPDQYLLSYFLGAAEISIAYLSFCSTKINDKYALRLIARSFIIFHCATAALEVYGLFSGSDPKIIVNIVLRIIISILFYFIAVHENKKKLPTTSPERP